ncbi:MAG: response regulator [Mucilaginibacter polytrichastri]|nr:response regulator [Mucilaginibacter polytrichastri]
MTERKLLIKKLDRERVARREAERITEEQNAELIRINEELIRAKKAQELFLANMSHEIRTPMNGVVGMASLLAETSLSAAQREFVDTIQEAAGNLIRIINDILDLSKIEKGMVQFEAIDFDLPSLLKKLKNILLPRADQKNIALETIIAAGIPTTIKGDPTRLNQILSNLADNAIKFTEKGFVKICVETVEEKDQSIKLRFCVHDSGIGIPASRIHAIFEKYTQADSNTTRLYGGTGLGLSIARNLVELQGGKLQVSSVEGEGSHFSFEIPFEKTGAIPEKKTGENSTFPIEKRVLIVEDNVINQRVAQLFLKKWGLSAEIADNGRIALEKLAQEKFDLILMDIHMPELDGIETTQAIRSSTVESLRNIPIIAMTASTLMTDMDHYKSVGMNGYISKPFKGKDLYETIRAAIFTNVDCPPYQETPRPKAVA